MVFDDQEVSTILGKSVRGSTGEDMGRIIDIIVSRDGQVHAAIIDFGGFLGIGTRKIAVDWRALNFAPAGKPGSITLEFTRNQVRLAPEYKRGEPVVVPRSGRYPLSHRSPPPAAAGAGSIGSRSASPTCRPDLGRSSPSISRRRDGRRSTSASLSPPAALPDWRCKCPAGPSSMPRGRNAASPRWR
jgi:sporulation protein YlmC with PRC-barrel domain